MCGRYVTTSPPDQIARYFDAVPTETSLPANYNTAPTNDVYGIVEGTDGVRRLEVFHWGLVPVWAKDMKIASKMINARSEGLATKPAFKAAFKRKRCLIPDGRILRVEGCAQFWARVSWARRASRPNSRCSFIASMANRWP